MKYKLYFINSEKIETLIGEYNCPNDYMYAIDSFLKAYNYKSYYKRFMLDSETKTIIDVGSHTEFFKVVSEND